MNALERLEGLLDERDAEIKSLKGKLREAEETLENDWSQWGQHFKSDESHGLPVPRLEVRWKKCGDSWYERTAVYSLVRQWFVNEPPMAVPLSSTRCSGGNGRRPLNFDGTVDLPYRDGAHIYWDMMNLRLPAFAICEEVVTDLSTKRPGYEWWKEPGGAKE